MAILVLIGTVFLIIVSIKSNPTHFYACAAAMVHRNHFFRLYQHNKSTESEVNLERLVILAKRFLKLPRLYMLIKQKSPSLSRNEALGALGELSIVFRTMVNLLYHLNSTVRRCCLLHLIKKNFFNNSNLD